MRIRFDEQLEQLNKEMINMGTMIEDSIGDAVKALMKQDVELAKKVMAGDAEIDRTERKIEDLCLRLLLQQQPVARDLRTISAALKMVTDMERIGAHATDISELAIVLSQKTYVKKLDHIEEMARETMVMLIQSLEAYVEKDLDKAQKVIAHDDVIDELFEEVKQELIELIRNHADEGEQAVDLLMVTKYFERIGDHASYIAHLSNEMHDNHIGFSQAAWDELNVVMEAVREEINITCNAFMNDDKEAAQRVAPLGMLISRMCDELKLHHVSRLSDGTCGLEEGTVFNDILNSFNRIAAHSASAMVALMKSGEVDADPHIHDSKIYPSNNPKYFEYLKEYCEKYDMKNEEHVLSMEPEEIE